MIFIDKGMRAYILYSCRYLNDFFRNFQNINENRPMATDPYQEILVQSIGMKVIRVMKRYIDHVRYNIFMGLTTSSLK